MEVIKETINDIVVNYPLVKLGSLDKMLFIDIETTGFSAKSSNLYLIGCLYHRDDCWNTVQFFADNYSDEQELIEEFFSFASDYDTLIHFNGNNFDLPYILEKSKLLGFEKDFDRFEGIDIFKRIQPYRQLLKLENCKQKTIEAFLKIERDDKYNGGELISIYHSYVNDHDQEKRKLLLLHNFEDLKGMLSLLPILTYCDLANNRIRVTKVSANFYTDESGNPGSELLMVFDIDTPIPQPVSASKEGFYLSAESNQGMIKVPLIEGELKYFYANYHDYYYLPNEDMAVHKSVGEFVDKAYREKAKASNCYTKKSGLFLKEWDLLISPFFKQDYDSKDMFFELTDERKKDRELFSHYAAHVLSHLSK